MVISDVRAMLIASDLNFRWWGWALKTAAWVRNQHITSPAKVSPFEKLNGYAPDLSKLRIWGVPSRLLKSGTSRHSRQVRPAR